MLRAPTFLLSLLASLVLFVIDRGPVLAAQSSVTADTIFDGSVINSHGNNKPGIAITGSGLSVLITDSADTTDGQPCHDVVLSGAST